MKYTPQDHTFVICAYKESPYLRECIESLLNQTASSHILVATSTPNEFITNFCDEYDLPLCINTGKKGIAGDWNFALSCAKTELITLAHQDDLYEPEYTEEMLCCVNRFQHPIMFSSAYSELRNGEKVTNNRLLQIKKVLRFPMWLAPSSRLARRASLALGDSICCPSVTYLKSVMETHPFKTDLRCSLDWGKWEELSQLKGSFAFSSKCLMAHRIHEDSETSNVINSTGRNGEDFIMYRKFWPESIAKVLAHLYAASEKSNSLGKSE